MLVSVIMLYFAIKFMPFGKKVLLLLVALPISVEGFVSMSPDALTISAVFLFIAYVLKLFNEKDKKITLKDKVILFGLSIVIALCKIVYLPIVGLLLILPKEKFKTKKEQIITIGIIMGTAILANLAWLVFSTTYLVTFRGGDSKYQLVNILSHPIQYIIMLFNTININSGSYLYSAFGGEIGWDEYVKLQWIVPIVFGGLYIFFSASDIELKNRFNKYQQIIIGLIVLAVVVLIFTSLYIQWTAMFSSEISGVQGRYFIPILPLISLVVLNKLKLKNEYTEEVKLKMLGITIWLTYIYVFLTIVINNL